MLRRRWRVLLVVSLLVAFATPASAVPKTGSWAIDVVQPGDTLSAIANCHGTTWQRLMQLNGLTPPRHCTGASANRAAFAPYRARRRHALGTGRASRHHHRRAAPGQWLVQRLDPYPWDASAHPARCANPDRCRAVFRPYGKRGKRPRPNGPLPINDSPRRAV